MTLHALHPISERRQYSTFRVSNLWLGIPIVKVQEVFRYQEMTPVPLAAPSVRGLINLRGQIVTALDLRSTLSLPPIAPEALPMNIVLQSPFESKDGLVSRLVDDIEDVLEVSLDLFNPVPENMPEAQKQFLEGVYHVPQGLLLVLDTTRVLEDACT